MRWERWVLLLVLVVLAGLFAALNASERVTLNLGLFVLYRVSLARLVLGSFLLGMVAMFLIGLRQDLALRRQLRERGWLDREPAEREFPREVPREEPHASRWQSGV